MNKKQLYESIMSSVAKQVKRYLMKVNKLENMNFQKKIQKK